MRSRRAAAAPVAAPAPAAALAGCLLLALAVASGCGDDDSKNPAGPGNPSATTVMTGTFVGAADGGLATLSLSTADLAPRLPRAARPAPGRADSVVTASMTLGPFGGGAINLTGTYDTQTDSLHAAGQGYSVRGRSGASLAGPTVLVGNYASGSDAGSFICTPGGSGSVRVYCGEFQSATGPATGRLNLVFTDGTLFGLFCHEGLQPSIALAGTVTGTGTVRSISFSGSVNGTGSWNTATDEVSGAWTSVGGDTGSWTGERCLPPDDN
jgi:hypothetical protein